MGRFINADAYASTGQGMLGNNMFTYCLNNPVAYIDSSGTAAYVCWGYDEQPNEDPWKEASSCGGGRFRDTYYSRPDYGSVADKFYTVRALRFLGKQIAHSANKLWNAYVYSVERSSDLCLQRNITMQYFVHDLFSSVERVRSFWGICSTSVGAFTFAAKAAVTLGETITVTTVIGGIVAIGAVGFALAEIVWYFDDLS